MDKLPATAPVKVKKKFFRMSSIVISIIAIAGIGVSSYFFMKYQQAQKLIEASGIAGQAVTEELVKKISQSISLPEGELPTVATVSDRDKLKDQPFFEKSENGDKVLIYTKAKKAYLYRPSADKLIDVTIVNVDPNLTGQSPDASSEATPEELKEIKIVLRNGTAFAGLTNKIEPEIKKALANSTIVKKENAANKDYKTTIVVVLNEQANQAATTLADSLKATVASLPAGEIKPDDTDILIIIGQI